MNLVHRRAFASSTACAGVVALLIPASCTLACAQAAEGSGSELVGGGAMEKSPTDTAGTGATGDTKGGVKALDGAKPNASPGQGGDPSSGSPSPSTNPE